MHDMIRPLAWLLGKWRAEIGGRGQYPTITSFEYGEEVEFYHVGQPNVQFRSGFLCVCVYMIVCVCVCVCAVSYTHLTLPTS